MPAGTTVAWPLLADTLNLNHRNIRSISSRHCSQGKWRLYRASAAWCSPVLILGFMVVPSLPFLFNNDSTQLAFSDSFLVLVTEFPVDMEKEIMDIKGPMEVPVDWKKYHHLWAHCVGGYWIAYRSIPLLEKTP
jgi:hypothetical protein